MSYTSTRYNSVAYYSCTTGYRLVGSITRTCQISGLWSGSQPSCTRMFLLVYSFQYSVVACVVKALFLWKGCPCRHSVSACKELLLAARKQQCPSLWIQRMDLWQLFVKHYLQLSGDCIKLINSFWALFCIPLKILIIKL